MPFLYALVHSVYPDDPSPDFLALFISPCPVHSAEEIPFESLTDVELRPESDYIVYRVAELSEAMRFTTPQLPDLPPDVVSDLLDKDE